MTTDRNVSILLATKREAGLESRFDCMPQSLKELEMCVQGFSQGAINFLRRTSDDIAKQAGKQLAPKGGPIRSILESGRLAKVAE